jgi:hypothetical protein
MSEDFFSKIEIVDRSNFYCTGKLLPNIDMQKWKKKKRKLQQEKAAQIHQILKENKSKLCDGAVGSKEYRKI